MKLKRGDIKMKIEEQVLSREQMAHLRELGIDTSDASLCWRWSNEGGGWVLGFMNPLLQEISNPPHREGPFPSYTIGDLIEKLPKSIDLSFGEYDLELSIKGEYVEVQYENDYDDCTPFFCSNLSLIESLYRILCWLAENHKELL